MSDFIITEAIEEEGEEEIEEEGNNFVKTESDDEFIDDETEFDDQNPSDYYGFTNVERSYDDAIKDSLTEFDFNQEASNYNIDDDDDEIDDDDKIDEFKDFELRVQKFKQSLFCPQNLENEDSLFYSILYAIRYHFTKKFDSVSDDEIKNNIGSKIFDEIFPLKKSLKLNLDVSTFEDQCYTVNHILNKNNLFIRIFEQKDKFRHITETNESKKNIKREISSCLKEKFNGFIIVRIDFDRKIRQKFSPIDIIYKPVKNKEQIINCFFSAKIHLGYRTTYSHGEKSKLRHGFAYRCHYCRKYFCREERLNSPLKACTGQPGYVYNFDTENLLTFEENIKLKHDISLTAYIDFETTAPTDQKLDPENCKMNAVSYSIIFAFHHHLKMKRVIIERSFGHSLEKLTMIDYLTSEQLKFNDEITLKQLRDIAIEVSEKKCVHSISKMFSIELKFASDCLLKWFYSKHKK